MRSYDKYIEEYKRRHAHNDPFSMADLVSIDQMNRTEDGRPDRAGCMIDSLRIGWVVGFKSAQRQEKCGKSFSSDLTTEEKILLYAYRKASEEQRQELREQLPKLGQE